MNIKLLSIITLFSFLFLSFKDKSKKVDLNITWVNKLEGDFNFTKNWSYKTHLVKNDMNQLICDGICSQKSRNILDSMGRIPQDSISKYYQLIDTNHYYHTFQSKTNCYEWGTSNFIHFNKRQKTIYGYSELNESTHCTLKLILHDHRINAWIEYNSVANAKNYIFPLKAGKFILDKNYFKKGVLKAKFKLHFINKKEHNKPIQWEGLICTKIE